MAEMPSLGTRIPQGVNEGKASPMPGQAVDDSCSQLGESHQRATLSPIQGVAMTPASQSEVKG